MMKYNLKELFDTDPRGRINPQIGDAFVEQINDNTAILSYYGQGDSHEGIFSYDIKTGWKFEKYYDRWFENLSNQEKSESFKKFESTLKKEGFTEIKDDGKHITYSRTK
jgi:hypothetical protein